MVLMGFSPSMGGVVDPTNVGYDLGLVAGQSKAVGVDTAIDLSHLDPTSPRIWVFANTGTYANRVSLGIDPLAHHSPALGVGPAMEFGRRYVQTVAEHRRLLLVPVAHSATGFPDAPSWRHPSGALYVNAVAQANLAFAAAEAETGVGTARWIGFFWSQGEHDAALEVLQADYEDDLDALIAGFRADIDGASASTDFVLDGMVPEYLADDSAGHAAARAEINRGHIATPARNTRCAFMPGIPGYPFDSPTVHYAAEGSRRQGRSWAAGLVLSRQNELGTQPKVPAAPTLTQQGTNIVAAWPHPGGRVTDYAARFREVGTTPWTTITRTEGLALTATATGTTNGLDYEVQIATVNEEATSAWSASGTIETVEAPGQVTNLALGALTTSAPLMWDAPAGPEPVTGYKLQFKKSADSTWLTYATVTGLSGTVASLIELTAYDFRVVAANAAGDGTPSSTVSGTTPALARLLTAVPVAAFRACSAARQLKSDYAGPLIRVRRSSDNTEQDIGSDHGLLDTAALLAFVGAGDGYITKLYDQSGNARDYVQTLPGSQPRIVASGVVDRLNGSPTMVGDGIAAHLTSTSSGLFAAGACTVEMVLSGSPATTGVRAFAEGHSTGSSQYALVLNIGVTGKLGTFLRNTINTGVINATDGPIFLDNTCHQVSVVDNGSGLTIDRRVDGGTVSSVTSTRSGTVTLDRASLFTQIAAGVLGVFLNGRISEIVSWGSALSGANRAAAENNQRSFYATA